jgi:dihydroorotate dehydrogenase
MSELLWKLTVRPLLFCLPPETAHYVSMGAFDVAMKMSFLRKRFESNYHVADPLLATECFGLRFENPVGLAAGFDKDARWVSTLGALGFGSIEVGSVTGVGQPGNPHPRLFRLPADRALINRMGFNNQGSEVMQRRLSAADLSDFSAKHVLGINLGKTRIVPLEQAVDDYCLSFRRLFSHGDYFVINVSSPNTPGLRSLQDRGPLTTIVQQISQLNKQIAVEKNGMARPILLKLSPDLSANQLAEIVELVLETGVAGVIATNTTTLRSGLMTPANRVKRYGDGGLSGAPLLDRSCQVVSTLFKRLQGRTPIIGVGGIFNGADAWQMIGAGASLIQLYTGFIYGGPGTARSINRYLIERIRQHELTSIAHAVGRDVS